MNYDLDNVDEAMSHWKAAGHKIIIADSWLKSERSSVSVVRRTESIVKEAHHSR